MKKILALGSSLATSLLLAAPAFAQVNTVDPCPNNSGSQYHVLCELTPGASLPFIFTWVIIIAIILALAFLIWGGIRWIMSAGDKTKVEAARSTIIAAIVGLIVIFLAWFIINLLTGIFFGHSLTDKFTLPQINVDSNNSRQANPTP